MSAIMSGIIPGIIPGIVMTFLAITVLVVLAAVEIRLARQAVIFALIGQLLATAWIFVTGDRVNRDIAQWKGARAVHGEIIYHYDPNRAPVGSDVWLSDGTRLVVRFCADNLYTDCREDRDHVERDSSTYSVDRPKR